MAEGNAERIKALYEAFSRQDFDAAVEVVHPEVEFIRVYGLEPIRGADALRAWMVPDVLEAHTVEPLDFTVKGSKVMVHQRHRARGAGSGMDVEAEAWTVYTFDDDGLVTRVEAFLDAAEALEATGLPPD